jgi:hypothetical protein
MTFLPTRKAPDRVLTDKQEAFLEHLFSVECAGSIPKALKAAGYGTDVKSHYIIKTLGPEIIERAEEMLAAHSPKATLAILGLIDDPECAGAKTKLMAASTVLDRVGISKKEKVEVSGQGAMGIFILPPKREE